MLHSREEVNRRRLNLNVVPWWWLEDPPSLPGTSLCRPPCVRRTKTPFCRCSLCGCCSWTTPDTFLWGWPPPEPLGGQTESEFYRGPSGPNPSPPPEIQSMEHQVDQRNVKWLTLYLCCLWTEMAEILFPGTFFQDVLTFKISALHHFYFQSYRVITREITQFNWNYWFIN